MRLMLLLLGLVLATSPARAETRFVAVAFHDVVDRREDRAPDAVTTDSLIAFFEWLKADGWTPVSLDDIEAARDRRKTLPSKAILLTFDDGYRSVYTRVYPLLLAYRYPAVVALVGRWMDTPAGSMVDYGDGQRPRDAFIGWGEVRRMQASGLIEFASHSYDLHRGIRANPQGNLIPAARTWAWDPVTATREDDAAFLARISRDLDRAQMRLRQETGRASRALVWPFGRYASPAADAARAAGFRLLLTLDPEPADALRSDAIPRYYPLNDPSTAEIAANLRFAPPRPNSLRVTCASMAELAAGRDPGDGDQKLGVLIEAVRALGANTVVLDATPSGSSELPGVRTLADAGSPASLDRLSRAVWQLRTRAATEVFLALRLEEIEARWGAGSARKLVADMVRAAVPDGLALHGPGGREGADFRPSWETRAVREQPWRPEQGYSQLADAVMSAAAQIDPRLRLMLLAPPGAQSPGDGADVMLLPAVSAPQFALQVDRLARDRWLLPETSGRIILTLPTTDPAEALLRAQRRGASAFAVCPRPPDGSLRPVFSARSLPEKP